MVTPTVPETLFFFAVTVAVPTFLPFSLPLPLTLATDFVLLVQLTCVVMSSVVELLNVPVAVS